MLTPLFWVITQRVMTIYYRRFGTTCRSYLEGSRIPPPKKKFFILER